MIKSRRRGTLDHYQKPAHPAQWQGGFSVPKVNDPKKLGEGDPIYIIARRAKT
jgi:hypothetical protein